MSFHSTLDLHHIFSSLAYFTPCHRIWNIKPQDSLKELFEQITDSNFLNPFRVVQGAGWQFSDTIRSTMTRTTEKREGNEIESARICNHK